MDKTVELANELRDAAARFNELATELMREHGVKVELDVIQIGSIGHRGACPSLQVRVLKDV